ncbi:hypothetical protein L596_024141 [Steinernema carpocapsae]|uniref:Probable arginine--tRNA ligase, cytoplasmic n=1 Tax=Steinernema carpocapsae TaxID=34508 RepID=A0A4U5MFU8_STECR|nr:hypothetical protein L596_024141 [Steinernema carpocapsae]
MASISNGPSKSAAQEIHEAEAEYNAAFVQVEKFERLQKAMEAGELTAELLEECPELAAKLAENEKLKYRIEVLKASAAEQAAKNSKVKQAKPETSKAKPEASKKSGEPKEKKAKGEKSGTPPPAAKPKINYVHVEDYGDSIFGRLKDIFAQAIAKAFPEEKSLPVILTEATNPKFGNYQLNSAMAISKVIASKGTKKSPLEVAKLIKENLPATELIEKVDVAGPGFINIFIDNTYVCKRVASIFKEGNHIPKVQTKRAIVDFSSPNIAKQMHVGHLRTTIIGEVICRLLEFVKFDVLRLNHLGDWGTQFGMLIAHLQDEFPNYLNETPPVADLQEFYKASKKRFDEDEVFKKRAYECVVQLQGKEPNIVKAWQMICDVSRKDFDQLYNRLDISLTERGESYYQDMMVDVVKELQHRGFLKVEDGRTVMFPTGCTVPLTVVKSDGGNTYDTSDLAALRNRLIDEKADWVIYVVDAGQSLHLETIYQAGQDVGWYNPTVKRVEHVPFGLVLGEDKKKFKTRSGDTVKLSDLLDEGVKRAAEKIAERDMTEEERKVASEAVAYSCIKYADLSHNRINDYVFSYDRMLDDKGNTAVYLLYAYARMKSIRRNLTVSSEELTAYIDELKGNLPLNDEREIALAKHILKFSDCILTVLESLQPHQLCDYLYNLATLFHEFYTACYVINTDTEGNKTINLHRVVLMDVTVVMMDTCFKLLGLQTLEKM